MGRAVVLGDSINTDQIISGEYVRRDDYVNYLFGKFRDDINELVRTGKAKSSVIVAGRNFGSGSSRERAAIGLMEAGFQAVVAYSYNPIWERNAINCGLRVFRFEPGVRHDISGGNELEIAKDSKTLYDTSTKRSYRLMDTPEFVREIWMDEGLVNSLRRKIAAGRPGRPVQ